MNLKLKLNSKKLRELLDSSETLSKMTSQLYRRTESISTIETYLFRILKFIEWTGVDNPDKLITKYDITDKLDEYIDYCINEKGYAPQHIGVIVDAVKKWSKVAGKGIDTSSLTIPYSRVVERSVLPRKRDVRKMLSYSPLRGKCIILFAMSSGLRISTILSLKIRH